MTVPRKHAELIKAWADGAEIEGRSKSHMEWHKITEPHWFDSWEYRVKGHPKPDFIKQYFHYMGHWVSGCHSEGNNIVCTFDGETGKLKSVEVIKW